jgi:hypothetical protein
LRAPIFHEFGIPVVRFLKYNHLSMQTDAPMPAELAIAAAHRRARHCRVAAVVILVVGLISAGIVYWYGSRQAEADDLNDPAMLGFNRATERQMGVLYGKQGQLMEDLNDSLKEPGTQAILIIIGSVIIAVVCFQFARMLEFEAREIAARPPSN